MLLSPGHESQPEDLPTAHGQVWPPGVSSALGRLHPTALQTLSPSVLRSSAALTSGNWLWSLGVQGWEDT